MVAVVLSPNARALIELGRSFHRPTIADRRRVGAALRTRLGASVLPTETPVRDLLISLGWQLPSGTVLSLCLFGGALLLAPRPQAVVTAGSAARGPLPTAALSASATTSASDELGARATPRASLPVAATSAPTSERPATPSFGAPEPADPLAREVQLLSHAMGELHSGRAENALSILDEHQLRFPNGALSQERCALRARALCKLKRFPEGRAELAGLPPNSFTYERIHKLCASPMSARSP